MKRKLISKKINEAYILLHMDCELKCRVCPYWGAAGACNSNNFKKKYSKKLGSERIKRFIDEIACYKPNTVTLSGGEPLTCESWVDIARHVKSRGINVTLSTNGLHMSRYLREIVSYVDTIVLSLGGTKDILKKIRTADYGFDEVVDNLKKISDFKRKKNRKKPYIRIIYVISDLSYRKMKELYLYLRNKGIVIDNFYFQHVIYIDKESLEAQKELLDSSNATTEMWEGYLYSPGNIDFGLFFEQVDYLKRFRNVRFSPQMSKEEIKQYYDPKKKNSIKRNFVCFAPWNQIDLYPNGDIMVCPDYVVGNIQQNTFNEIWNGEKAINLRKYLLKNKEFPGCRSCFYYYVSNEEAKPKI